MKKKKGNKNKKKKTKRRGKLRSGKGGKRDLIVDVEKATHGERIKV